MSLNFFNPKRTQPFIITLFMAIMAFKRVCKMMRKRLKVLRKGCHSHQLSEFRRQLKKSHLDVVEAARGRNVITSTFIQTQSIRLLDSKAISHIPIVTTNELKIPRKVSTHKKVSRYLDDYQVKLRLGKGAPATVDRLQKSLVIADAPKFVAPKIQAPQSAFLKRKSSMIMSAMKAAEVKPVDFAKPHSAQTTADQQKLHEEAETHGEDELGYEPGTSIYFGATIALQARHGGFLSYNSSEIKASAHKVLNNSRFIVKNSEDLTDVGVMKYGMALWLQAGHHDVLGAQYGTLVDQKRTIQPALVSCKRSSMFKAQQYGRWIILNRSKPMETLGQPVLHDDKVMLEQEWFFLASTSPYQSSMYKIVSNSNEARTCKVGLFNPGEECSWKVHLVALPTDDKAGELQRQLLLQQAKESIEDSQTKRYEKAPALLTSLHSKLPDELTDSALFHGQLRRKSHGIENQEYLLNKYNELGAKQFHSNYNPMKFLSRVYGADSNIVKYKAFVLERNETDVSSSLYEHSHQAVYNPHHRAESTSEHAGPSSAEAAHDAYWNHAQRVRLDTKSWVELPTAMSWYYKNDRVKKMRAAMVLQKWIRKFLSSTFDFERAMKRVDSVARTRLQEKLIARRKMLIEHVSSIEAIEHNERAPHAASIKFGSAIPSKPRPKCTNSFSSVVSSATHTARAGAGNRPALGSSENNAAGGGGSSVEEHRRSKSLAAQGRSKSLERINDISQLVGASGMAAIFSAAGLIPGSPISSPPNRSPPKARSKSMIFVHTEVHGEGGEENTSGVAAGPGGGMLAAMHHQSQSMSKLPFVTRSLSPGCSAKKSVNTFEQHERLETQSNAISNFGFEAPPNQESGLPTIAHSGSVNFGSARPASARITSQQEFTESGSSAAAPATQRPFTANAALRAPPAAAMTQEQYEAELELAQHEARKAAQKENLRAQTLREKRRLCRSAGNEYGLPKDVFRHTHADVSAKIGLKFLRAVSRNPSIYDGVDVTKKRPSTSGGHRHGNSSGRGDHSIRHSQYSRHHHSQTILPPASSAW